MHKNDTAKSPAKAKKIIALGVLFILILSVLALLLLKYRAEINNMEVLRSYRIDSGAVSDDTASGEIVSLLKDITYTRCGDRLLPATGRSHLYLRLVLGEEQASSMGFSLTGYEENGYIITRMGNSIFLISKSESGITRAMWRLVYRLTDSSGNLLLAMNDRITDTGDHLPDEVLIGSSSLNDYVIHYTSEEAKAGAYELGYYLAQSGLTGVTLSDNVDGVPASNLITLTVDASLTGNTSNVHITDGQIFLTADDASRMLTCVKSFASDYLDWIFPGTGKESRCTYRDTLHLPMNTRASQDAWISEREAIVTLWNTNYSRGVFLNNSTSLKTDIMSFSDNQLYEYVKMLKYCGFTGIQATDMCSAWACAGNYEYAHERLRLLADAAHTQGMKFTLWVWGSEFNGYGWVDNTVSYSHSGYNFSYENPNVIATFDKYYSIYAELADCCDRVIGHFYDPGNLDYAEDVAYFSAMLRDKFLAVNPDIDFGVSCWVDQFDKRTLVEALGPNITLYETGYYDTSEDCSDFRTFCKNIGCRLGTWAWNTCEMEIDQMAQMNYNSYIIRDTYLRAAQYDGIMKPSYWSEMDSNHVINVFSLYCAGQMLKDPDRIPEEVTAEIAKAAVGPEYADDFAEVLTLLEDARSGHSRETYWWRDENYILKSAGYPAKDILARSESAMQLLEEMIAADADSYTLPLPLPLTDLLKLMLPQIEQINQFAKFRIGYDELLTMASSDTASTEIESKLAELSVPVSEYNTVTGLWGQVEARAQQEMLYDFCNAQGYAYPEYAAFKKAQKDRIYEYFVTYQKGHSTPVYQYSPYFQYGVAYGEDLTKELVAELIDE